MLNSLRQALAISRKSVESGVRDHASRWQNAFAVGFNRFADRASSRYVPYLAFGTSHRWLNRTLGVITFIIGIALAVLMLGEIGRETGFFIPNWDRQEVGKPLPGWSIAIYYGGIWLILALRSYFFFKPANGYKKR